MPKNKFKEGIEMKKGEKKRTIFILMLCATLAWMGFIFLFSSENDMQSTERSDAVTDRLAKAVNGNYIAEEKDGEFMNFYKGVSIFVRKSAHVLSYALLGALTYLVVMLRCEENKNFLKNGTLSVTICVIYASLDEFHQTFVDGRAGRVSDVLIDSIGIVIGTAITLFICRRVFAKRQRIAKEGAK